MIKRYHIIAEGRVQGVGFRSFCQSLALEYDLTGTVRNMSNGMVELYVQGEEEHLSRFISAVRTGNRWVRVDDLTIRESAVRPDEKRFRCEYYSSY